MPSAEKPPGPASGLLGLKLLRPIQDDFVGFAERLHAEYGDELYYTIGAGPARKCIYQFAHPDRVIEVLANHNKSFHKTARLRQVLGRWNGSGLLLNEGKSWARQRRLAQPAFSPQRVDSYAELIVRIARATFDPLADTTFNVALPLNRMTFQVVAEALFGNDVQDVTDEFLAAVDTLQTEAIADFTTAWVRPLWWPTSSRRRLRTAIATIDRIVKGFISDWRREGVDRGDLLSMLLLAVDEERGSGMTDQQARDEAVNLLLGGNETTATALTWTLYLLAAHPQDLVRVQQEIDYVCGGEPTAEHVPRLALTRAAMQEAMRLYPPAYVLSREAIEEVTIGPWRIPSGSLVFLPILLTQRDGRWFDRPNAYVPNRFLGEEQDAIPQGAYLPFGAGPRACIGKGFALLEGTLALATLIGSYNIELAEGQAEPEAEAQVSLHPKDGVRLTFGKRG